MTNNKTRCEWSTKNDLEQRYHDKEWGVPVHDDRRLFEFLILEGQQAGLSWSTILAKREGYREALDGFDVKKISKYNQKKMDQLLKDERIVRNKLKVNSVVSNANAFLDIQKEYGTFDTFIWNFVGGKTIKNKWRKLAHVPTSIDLSDRMSKELKERGFKFVGTTICYAFMQAVGMVNDHVVDCFRYHQVGRLK